MAMDNGLDLVEVSPNQDPPVCRLLDYGKFKYNLSKRDKKNKKISHLPLIKQSRLSVMPIDYKSWKIVCNMGKI